jgi:large subunit ribosomal protein L24
MAALQGAMASLSVSAPGAASTSSFWGNRLATYSAPQPGVCSCFQLPFRSAALMVW